MCAEIVKVTRIEPSNPDVVRAVGSTRNATSTIQCHGLTSSSRSESGFEKLLLPSVLLPPRAHTSGSEHNDTWKVLLREAVDAAQERREQKRELSPVCPEYDDRLEKLTLFSPPRSAHSSGEYARDERVMLDAQVGIIQAAPKHTHFTFYVAEKRAETYIRERLDADQQKRTTFLSGIFLEKYNFWAQDIGEGDGSRMVVPTIADHWTGTEKYGSVAARHGSSVTHIDVRFAGGNTYLCRDKEGRSTLLIGAGDFLASQKLYSEKGQSLSEQDFCDGLQRAFGTERVLIVGMRDDKGRLLDQSSAHFHLDLCMLPIAHGKIAVVKYHEPSKEEVMAAKAVLNALQKEDPHSFRKLQELFEHKAHFSESRPGLVKSLEHAFPAFRTILEDEHAGARNKELDAFRKSLSGFDFVEFPCGITDADRYFLNGIIFKEGEQKKFLMPVYDGFSASDPALVTKHIDLFANQGVEVVTVKERTRHLLGSLHCLTNRN